MRRRNLGPSGIEASVVGFGAWAIGGWMWGGTDEKAAIAGIQAALDAGIDLVDTAPIYGFGLSEELVGKAIEDRRERVVLATKCGLVWDTTKGDHYFEHKDKTVFKYLGGDSIAREVEASLRRLRTDYIDLYQTHWQETTTAREDTMAALVALKDQGKIRAIGVSNASSEQMEEYQREGALDSDQERYSMLDRRIEEDQLPYCRERGMAVLAYSPIAQGLLTGKVGPDRSFDEGDQRRNKERFSVENREKVADMLAEFLPVARDRNATLAQLVIAWTVAQEGLTHALVGARNPEQALENAKAGDLVLSPEELELIDDAIDRHAKDIP